MKKHKGPVIAGVVLAALVVYCLWYVWPRGWNSLTGPVTDEVVSLNGAVNELYFQSSVNGKVDTGFHSWLIQWEEAEGPATEAILEAFQNHSYRKA